MTCVLSIASILFIPIIPAFCVTDPWIDLNQIWHIYLWYPGGWKKIISLYYVFAAKFYISIYI